MPDREQDTLTAIYNRLRRKREEILQEAERLAEQMRATQDLAKTLGSASPTSTKPQASPKLTQPKERIPITRLIEDFTRDSSLPRRFTAPQLVQYINSRGYYGENLYSAAFETLKRKVKKHQLSKEGSEFVVPMKGATQDGSSTKVPDNNDGGDESR
jgi:hypothetical protein